MKIQLNNPLPLVSIHLLGLGVKLTLENVNDKFKLCFTVDLIVWSWCKEWGG